MKSFWKTVWASAVGVLLVTIFCTILFVMFISSLTVSSLSGSTITKVEPQSILDIDMSRTIIAEQTLEPNPFDSPSFIFGSNETDIVRTVGILDATKALEKAAVDPNIKMVYVRPDQANDIAHLEEFRKALIDFHACGKPVIAYIETPTNAGFYLASAADRIYMAGSHGSINMLLGINGKMMFIKDLLDKLGINVQLIRHGKYKSAGEMFIRNNSSPENMEQNKVMVDAIWAEIAAAIAERSGMSIKDFNSLLDNLQLVCADDFLKAGLVNEVVSYNEMKEKLCIQCGNEDYDDLKSISLADYCDYLKNTEFSTAKEKIAIVYLDGEIVDGRAPEEVAGKVFADIIDEVRKDDDVKAVVLRVNSPGGSVVAATQIKEAVDSLCATKPVVASYGSYAASGGYWVSAGCGKIYCDATTLTGSIGVFGLVPDFSGTMKNIAHVNITSVPSNKHSDMFSMMRPLDDREMAYMQKDIEFIYDEFTGLVSKGRGLSVERVDELGQGRVWCGRDAKERQLVDEIGTLADAVNAAASEAFVSNYKIEEYPAPATMVDMLIAALEPEEKDYLVEALPFGKALIKEIKSIDKPVVYARLPYCLEIR